MRLLSGAVEDGDCSRRDRDPGRVPPRGAPGPARIPPVRRPGARAGPLGRGGPQASARARPAPADHAHRGRPPPERGCPQHDRPADLLPRLLRARSGEVPPPCPAARHGRHRRGGQPRGAGRSCGAVGRAPGTGVRRRGGTGHPAEPGRQHRPERPDERPRHWRGGGRGRGPADLFPGPGGGQPDVLALPAPRLCRGGGDGRGAAARSPGRAGGLGPRRSDQARRGGGGTGRPAGGHRSARRPVPTRRRVRVQSRGGGWCRLGPGRDRRPAGPVGLLRPSAAGQGRRAAAGRRRGRPGGPGAPGAAKVDLVALPPDSSALP